MTTKANSNVNTMDKTKYFKTDVLDDEEPSDDRTYLRRIHTFCLSIMGKQMTECLDEIMQLPKAYATLTEKEKRQRILMHNTALNWMTTMKTPITHPYLHLGIKLHVLSRCLMIQSKNTEGTRFLYNHALGIMSALYIQLLPDMKLMPKSKAFYTSITLYKNVVEKLSVLMDEIKTYKRFVDNKGVLYTDSDDVPLGRTCAPLQFFGIATAMDEGMLNRVDTTIQKIRQIVDRQTTLNLQSLNTKSLPKRDHLVCVKISKQIQDLLLIFEAMVNYGVYVLFFTASMTHLLDTIPLDSQFGFFGSSSHQRFTDTAEAHVLRVALSKLPYTRDEFTETSTQYWVVVVHKPTGMFSLTFQDDGVYPLTASMQWSNIFTQLPKMRQYYGLHQNAFAPIPDPFSFEYMIVDHPRLGRFFPSRWFLDALCFQSIPCMGMTDWEVYALKVFYIASIQRMDTIENTFIADVGPVVRPTETCQIIKDLVPGTDIYDTFANNFAMRVCMTLVSGEHVNGADFFGNS